MKVIIGSGKVANIIKNENDVVLTHKEIEITDKNSVINALSKFDKNTVIVNTAAKINLEWCEENKEEAQLVNTQGVKNIAEVSAKHDYHLVHISSGCIFDGMDSENIFEESDTPTPACWYAKTKADADDFLQKFQYDKTTIIRPRQLISPIPNATNMLTKFSLLDEATFIDAKNSITCIEDLKSAIDYLCSKKHYGIYNVVNTGWISPFEIALKVRNTIAPNLKVTKISYQDYLKKLKVKRVNTLLSNKKLLSTGFAIRSSSDALDWCLENYGKNI